MNNKETQEWQCGVCNIITFGDHDAEVRATEEPNSEWLPCCKACSIEIRNNFIPNEEFEDDGEFI